MPTLTLTDEKKIVKLLTKLLRKINRAKLNIPELLVLYGNLGYHLGASVAGLREGPDLATLKRMYYEKPTVDVGLMLQGLLITDWEQDYLSNPQLSSIAQISEAQPPLKKK